MKKLNQDLRAKIAHRRIGITLLAMLALALPVIPALATPPGYALVTGTVAGGGGVVSTGGSYSAGATIGQPSAGAMSGGQYSVTGGYQSIANNLSLVGHVNWQGRPTQPNTTQQLPVTITLKTGANEANYPVTATDANGFFTVTVSALQPGTYNYRIKGPKYLASSGALTLAGDLLTNVEMGTMLAGDANDDNAISVQDFNILKPTFGRQVGEPGYDDRADFTGDQLVSITDFNLIKNNFGSAGAPPLNP